MNTIEISNELIQFIESSPSMFHSIKTIRTYLDEAGFTYLPESKAWDVKAGGKYYTIRNHSSLIAFKVGNDMDSYHFQMCASHSDSPTYKVKNVPELAGPNEYLRLDVEAYGGMIDNTWFDRPLTVAGRVLVRNGSKIESKLLYIDKDILMIPNVAIHFNREVNNGYKYNRQIDLCPMFSCGHLRDCRRGGPRLRTAVRRLSFRFSISRQAQSRKGRARFLHECLWNRKYYPHQIKEVFPCPICFASNASRPPAAAAASAPAYAASSPRRHIYRIFLSAA